MEVDPHPHAPKEDDVGLMCCFINWYVISISTIFLAPDSPEHDHEYVYQRIFDYRHRRATWWKGNFNEYAEHPSPINYQERICQERISTPGAREAIAGRKPSYMSTVNDILSSSSSKSCQNRNYHTPALNPPLKLVRSVPPSEPQESIREPEESTLKQDLTDREKKLIAKDAKRIAKINSDDQTSSESDDETSDESEPTASIETQEQLEEPTASIETQEPTPVSETQESTPATEFPKIVLKATPPTPQPTKLSIPKQRLLKDLHELVDMITDIEAHRQVPPLLNDDERSLTDYINLYMRQLARIRIIDSQSRSRIRNHLLMYRQALISSWRNTFGPPPEPTKFSTKDHEHRHMIDLCDLIKLIRHIEAHRQPPPPPNDDRDMYWGFHQAVQKSPSPEKHFSFT
jgi:hypothetical protein